MYSAENASKAWSYHEHYDLTSCNGADKERTGSVWSIPMVEPVRTPQLFFIFRMLFLMPGIGIGRAVGMDVDRGKNGRLFEVVPYDSTMLMERSEILSPPGSYHVKQECSGPVT